MRIHKTFIHVCALALALAGGAPAAADDPIFTDVAAERGLDFVHWNGMTGEFHFPEMTGQGGAFVDYDGDGDLDVYLVQGAMLEPGKTPADALFPLASDPPPRDRLYRNDLAPGPGGRPVPRFVDVTDPSGLIALGYGMGVAAGDFDNDGWVDLYVTNYGPNQLWRNLGDGRFSDVTAASGTDDPRWSTSTAFLDFDGDGWLDLYVTNYVRYEVGRKVECFATSSRRDYCGPSAFEPAGDSLFHNLGPGAGGAVTFEDVSLAAGIGRQKGAGLGVVAADFDGDGRTDLYVANDGQPNFLWINRGDGTFFDDALLAGVAVNRQGRPEASMGVDAGDFDGDGDVDLFMTHLMGETNTLYVNDGTGLFEDRTIESGLGPGSLSFTSFGTSFIDYDNDGWLDLLAMNGAVRILEPLARSGDPYPLDQPNQLFRNLEGRGFEEVSERAGPAFALAEVSRGAAFGDVDNDGDLDVLQINNNGPARLLINRAGDGRPWLGVRAIGRAAPGSAGERDLLGTLVEVRRAGAPSRWRRAAADGGYCSANDPRVVVGLADSPKVTAVRLVWPDGRVEEWRRPAVGRSTTYLRR